MILGIIAMIVFTRLTPGGSYATHVLPGLVPAGAGAACVFSASFATGTLGVRHTDAGVAAAVVNTAQQIGGSIGTALLSTIFADSLAGYLAAHPGASRSPTAAIVHAYTTGFTAGGAIFAAGLLLAVILLPAGTTSRSGPLPRRQARPKAFAQPKTATFHRGRARALRTRGGRR
jgi:hypothetical protein